MYMDAEIEKRLKGAANTLDFAAMRLRILGDKNQSKIVDAESAQIRYFLSCNEDVDA